MAELTKARAEEYFNYQPETGHLIFNERPRDQFTTDLAYTQHLKRVGKIASAKTSEGYIKVHIDGIYYRAHRVAWLINKGETPKYPEFEIDHINGDRADNRISNLRTVTKSQNQKNSSQRVTNTSGVHGVNWTPKYNNIENDGRWVARIWNGPKHVYLGQFRTLHEAQIARKAAERVLGYTGTDRPPYNRKAEHDVDQIRET